MHTALGLRYEKTDVVSTALVPTARAITWTGANEFRIDYGPNSFTTLSGKYHHLLPSLDWDLDLRPDMKLRASYGETIGRPAWNQIQGGQQLDALARVSGGTGTQGNPGLKPVKSKNFDASLEWYYASESFASINLFRKNLSNYPGQSVISATPFNVRTPVGGALWQEAAAQGGCGSDPACIRNWIFANRPGAAGVSRNPDLITAQPGDPVANFNITTVSNQKQASLRGVELNLQHMFGNSGFGVASNYTYVKSSLAYDNASTAEQFALVGLSDSANLVGIYEDANWTVRAAYNWRDKFLTNVVDPSNLPGPSYVEAYGQLDLSLGYSITPKLSLQFEAINLTDETTRIHSRRKEMPLFVLQSGPRYMAGVRYKF